MSDTLRKENIPVSEIGTTLDGIWKKLEEKKTIKACLFNLLIYEESSEPHTVLHSTLENVVSQYPCRVISVYEDRATRHNEVRADVSAELIGKGENLVAHDQISLKVPSALRMQTPFLVLPHILPDLPIYLLWAQNPANDSEVFPAMQELASHIIFDSSCVHDIAEYARYILKQTKKYSGGVSDLNWSMLDPWRDTIRRVIHSEERVKALSEAKHLRIQYNAIEDKDYNDQLPAFLLQAWIAASLNWSFLSCDSYEGSTRVTYKHVMGEASISLVPEARENLPHGAITCFSATSYHNDQVLIRQDETGPFVHAHCTTQDHCDFPTTHHLDPNGNQAPLIKRVLQNYTSYHYINTLKLISHMDIEA